jgi:predicted nucleic acid-binding protein
MPQGYLLDTNVVSETRKRRADPNVVAFLNATNAQRLFISVLTIGELRKGIAAKRAMDPTGAAQLAEWADVIETTFADRVLPVDAAVARCWGQLSSGRVLPVIDALLAATALIHGLTLVTRDVRDVAQTGTEVLNPWLSG